MQKITAKLLLMAMLLSLTASMVACGETDTQTTTKETTDNTVDTTITDTEETRTMHALPDTLDFGGEDFNMAYPLWQGYEHYFFADEATGDSMNDAIYDRKVKTEEFLNVTIVQTNLGGLSDVPNEIQKCATAGDDVYQLALLHCIEGVSNMVTQGYIYNLDTLPYVDLDADWWNREQMDVLRLGKNTYYGVSDFMIPCPYAIFFNKEIVENNGMDNPYELVYDGKWTLDRFVDMAISATQDLNGDGQFTMDDIAGVTSVEGSSYISFMTAADQFITSVGNDGKIQLDMNNEKTIHIIETLYKMSTNPGTLYRHSTMSEDDTITLDTGRLLFYLGSVAYAETLRDCDIDVGILPYPKYDEEQENYVSQDWGGLMCVPVSIQNPDMVGATMEYLSWESDNEVIPAYYDKTLSGKLSRDEDSRNMLELLFDTIAYEIGGNYFGFSSGFIDLFYVTSNLVIGINNPSFTPSTDFASYYAKNEKAAQSTIDKFYEALEKIEG